MYHTRAHAPVYLATEGALPKDGVETLLAGR